MSRTIWVVGRGTSVGKSTIATALIRAYNQRGTSCLGFKPFAATRLRDDLDFLADELPHGRLYGRGAVELARASPLTPDELAEVVAPCYFLVYHWVKEIIMVRWGAPALNSARIARVEGFPGAADREDVQRVLEQKGWLDRLSDLPSHSGLLSVDRAHRIFAPEISAAADHLESLGPQVVVCEGSGHYLPVWPGQPQPDHIVIVDRHRVQLAQPPASGVAGLSGADPCPTVAVLDGAGPTGVKVIRTCEFPISKSSDVERVADNLISALFGFDK